MGTKSNVCGVGRRVIKIEGGMFSNWGGIKEVSSYLPRGVLTSKNCNSRKSEEKGQIWKELNRRLEKTEEGNMNGKTEDCKNRHEGKGPAMAKWASLLRR